MSHFKSVKVLFNSYAPCPPLNVYGGGGSRRLPEGVHQQCRLVLNVSISRWAIQIENWVTGAQGERSDKGII